MKMNVTIIGTSIYYIFMKIFFGLSFVYRTFENELFKWLGSNWSFPRFTKKKEITNVVSTETWKHDQLVGIMRKTSWDMEYGRTSKLQTENANSFPISKLQDISNGTLCLSIWTMFTIYIFVQKIWNIIELQLSKWISLGNAWDTLILHHPNLWECV
jgi:hypothetical protein